MGLYNVFCMTCISLRSLQNMAHLGVMEHKRAAYDVDLNIDLDMIVYGQRRFIEYF